MWQMIHVGVKELRSIKGYLVCLMFLNELNTLTFTHQCPDLALRYKDLGSSNGCCFYPVFSLLHCSYERQNPWRGELGKAEGSLQQHGKDIGSIKFFSTLLSCKSLKKPNGFVRNKLLSNQSYFLPWKMIGTGWEVAAAEIHIEFNKVSTLFNPISQYHYKVVHNWLKTHFQRLVSSSPRPKWKNILSGVLWRTCSSIF